MKKKVFSLMMTLLLAFMGVAKADVVTIGDPTSTTTNEYLPGYTLYDYAISQQIYTADEIGVGGTINTLTVWLKNTSSYARNLNVYMKEVSESVFASNTSWVSMTASDMVASFTMENGVSSPIEKVISLTTPFDYSGDGNLVICFQDVTGQWSSGLGGVVMNANGNQALYAYRDGTVYNVSNPGVTGTLLAKKNVVALDITSGGGGEGGEVVDVTIGDPTSTTTNANLPGYTLYDYAISQQIYTADEIGVGGTINTLTMWLKNSSSYARNINIYMKEVSESTFASNTSWVSMTASDMVASFTMENGVSSPIEKAISLTTPFAYSGNGNLVICFQDVTGQWSSGLGGVEMDANGNQAIYAYRDGSVYDVSNPGVNGTLLAKKNVVRLNITTAGGGDTPDYQRGLHTYATYGVGEEVEEMIDSLYIERPNGAWMEPYHFQLYNDGTEDVDVVLIDFLHNNGYFSMAEGTEYPITVAHNGMDGAVDLYINTNTEWDDTEEINSLLTVNTDERSTHLYQIVAAPYEPYCPDVWELAYDINDEINSPDGIDAPISREYFMSEITDNPDGLDLHQNYDLPDYADSIPDGYDAVLKFKVSKAMMLNARVKEGYENGKVALYTEDFGGEAGPMANNNYTERPFNGGGITPGGSGELTVHDGDPQTTNSYVPVYGLWMDDYTRSEMIYPAVELSDMTGTNINSMKFYTSNFSYSGWGNATVSIYMKEVSESTLTAYIGNAGATTVYSGSLTVTDNEMTINFTTPYHYNGGNLLVGLMQNTEGTYHSCYFYGQTITGASGYGYNSSSAANATFTQNNFLPKTTFAYGNGRSNRDVILAESFENGLNGWTTNHCHYSTGVSNNYTAHSGDYEFRFYYTANYPQYLISPMLTGTENGVDVSFYYMTYMASYAETFQVGYSTTTNDVDAFTFGTTVTATNDDSYLEYTESFPAGTKYVAVKHMSNDQFYLFVDDFTFTTSGAPAPVDPTPQGPVFSAGPVIAGLNILPGTYYLVASSTEEDYEVEFGIEELPCPLDLAQVVYPADDADGIQPNSVTLKWQLSPYCTEYRLWFSSTYWPDDEPNNPATILVDWTNNLAEAYTVSNLYNNTNYFWRIDQRTNGGEEVGGCTTYGEVWGFTTKLNIPDLTVTPDRIYEGETVTLNWNHVLDRTYRSYRIYKDGELIHTTPVNEVVTSWVVPATELEYNYPGTYTFNVTAVYDEGESDFSNGVDVTVGGYSAINGINGYVYEQDSITPIAGVTVTITGTDALLGQPQTYTATTNAEGYYQVQVYEGTYTSAIATLNSYQNALPYQNGPEFYVGHNAHHDDMNFIMDETFYYPAHVCARTVYVPGVVGDTLVQVWWEGWASDGGGGVPGGSGELTVYDGTATCSYVPVYGFDADYCLKSEMVMPAEDLAEMTNSNINSLKWEITSTASYNDAWDGPFKIFMKEINSTTLSSYQGMDGATIVYQGPIDAHTSTEITINFTTPYHYNGGNLLIGVYKEVYQSLVGWGSASFKGETRNGASIYGYGSTIDNVSTSQANFLPKTTFTYGGREVAVEENRALHHFNIYRTDCYNDNPTEDEITFLASVWRPDTSYFDVNWPEVPVGVYKWGVSAVYAGNQIDNPNNPDPAVEYPFEGRESEIMWSDQCGPCIDKDMQTDITVNVVCNSADSPEGCVVSFTNLHEGEQFNHPQRPITLDASGFQAITPFRKGDYLVTVYLPGYELLQVEESIWGHTDLRYVLTEIIYNVKNLYVSRTGWAMWEPLTWEDYPIPEGAIVGPSVIDFETGDFSQYGFDNNGSYPWTIASGGRGYCMRSGNAGVASSTSTITATVNYTMAGTVSFDYNSQGEGTTYDVSKFMIDGVQQFSVGADGTWRTFNADVAAGEHTFSWSYTKDGSVNPTGDCFLVDNINFNIGGSRAVAEERHLEGYKIMCTSIDGAPIFNHNTPVDQPFCQLTTVDPWSGQPMLIEGEHYLVKVATIYSTGESPWCEPVEWVYEPCDHWGPVDEVTAGTNNQGNHIEWVFDHGYNPYAPAGGGQGGEGVTSFSVDFENGIPADWTTIDANNDGFDWMAASAYTYSDLTNEGHNASYNYAISESYDNGTYSAIIPDNYLVSPLVSVVNGSTFSFWATDGNDSYGAEHFGVAVSTTGNTNASDFTTIAEWTLLSKGGAKDGGQRQLIDGIWYQKTVDLSAYAGQDIYIAVRHFNCEDQWVLCVDDFELTTGAKGGNDGISHYHNQEIYRQYAEDGIWLNFLGIDNVDFRAYLLYNLVKDSRFVVKVENDHGQFVVNPSNEMGNFMSVFESFYEEASYSFSLLSKVDIAELEATWENGVSAESYLSIRSDLQRDGNDPNPTFDSATPFCTDEGMQEYQSSYTGQTASEDADYGCVYSPRNPSWYTMRIGTPGPFVIHMEGLDPNTGAQRDIDFVMWGPFTAEELASGSAESLLTGDKIVDCNYSTSYSEDCYLGYPENEHQHNANHGTVNYHVPETGELYVLLITNFSNQPCNITFTKTEGSGDGDTDCDYVNPDILGFLITLDGEYLAFVGPEEREYDHVGEYGDHEYCVRPIYPGVAQLPDSNFYFSMGCPVCASTNGEQICDAGDPIYAEVNGTDDQVHIWWGDQPVPPQPAEPFYESFETGDFEGWTVVRNGGGNEYTDWRVINGETAFTSGPMPAHDGTYMAMSRSWSSSAYNVDNWLISPQVALNGSLTYWVMDDGQYHEHYDVYVSTTTTDISAFTQIYAPGNASDVWTEHTVDLSDYAGQMGYIAFRNMDYDQDFLFIDDITIGGRSANRSDIVSYNIYRSEDNVDYALIANVLANEENFYEYFDAPEAGTYYYQVTAVYSDGCESEPAISGENPEVNYVVVGVTGIGENSDNVNLFPNPTKGNVTIQAMNMHRITVVSVLGQVVFDTELDQDEYILNMAKFNTGMYMVRVYTDEGVTVKRVTVLH